MRPYSLSYATTIIAIFQLIVILLGYAAAALVPVGGLAGGPNMAAIHLAGVLGGEPLLGITAAPRQLVYAYTYQSSRIDDADHGHGVDKMDPGGGGTFYARSIKELKTTWNTEKAQELTAPLLAEAVSAQMETPLLRQQIASLQEQLEAALKDKRATETMQRIWLVITVVAVVFGLIFGIQPRLG